MSDSFMVQVRPSSEHRVSIRVDGAELSVTHEEGDASEMWPAALEGLQRAHRREPLDADQIQHYASFVKELLHPSPYEHHAPGIYGPWSGPAIELLDFRRLEVLAELIDRSRVPTTPEGLGRWASIFDSETERLELAAVTGCGDPIAVESELPALTLGTLAGIIDDWCRRQRAGLPVESPVDLAVLLRSSLPPMLLDQGITSAVGGFLMGALCQMKLPVPTGLLDAIWIAFADELVASTSHSGDLLAVLAPYALADPECPTERLWLLADAEPLEVARHPGTPPELLDLIVSRSSAPVRARLAAEGLAPERVLDEMLDDPTVDAAVAITSARSVPSEVLERLARATNPAVRRQVACHVGLPLAAIERLVDDPDLAVRRAARLNPKIVQRFLREIADSLRWRGGTWADPDGRMSADWPYPSVRLTDNEPGGASDYLASGLAKHPSTPSDVLVEIVRTASRLPTSIVLDRFDCPIEAMWAAVETNRYLDRVVGHPRCPRDIGLVVAGRPEHADCALARFGGDPAVRSAALGSLRLLESPVPFRHELPDDLIAELLGGRPPEVSPPSAASYLAWWQRRRSAVRTIEREPRI